VVDRAYHGALASLLRRPCRVTDFFFSLGECLRNPNLERALRVAATANLELVRTQFYAEESSFLLSKEWEKALKNLPIASNAAL
jgi:hypothetical protein